MFRVFQRCPFFIFENGSCLELHSVCFLPNISRVMRRACRRRDKCEKCVTNDSQRSESTLRVLDIDGRVVIKWIINMI